MSPAPNSLARWSVRPACPQATNAACTGRALIGICARRLSKRLRLKGTRERLSQGSGDSGGIAGKLSTPGELGSDVHGVRMGGRLESTERENGLDIDAVRNPFRGCLKSSGKRLHCGRALARNVWLLASSWTGDVEPLHHVVL